MGEFIEDRAAEAEAMEMLKEGADQAEAFLWAEGGASTKPKGAERKKKECEDAPIVSLKAREISDYCGWINFSDGRGMPTKVAMFLTRDELDVLEAVADSDGMVGPEGAERIGGGDGLSATVRRCVSALARGLRGRVERFPEDPKLAEKLVADIRNIAEASVRSECERAALMPEFKVRLESMAADLGLPGARAQATLERIVSSPETCGGVLPIVNEQAQELVCVKPGAVECLRRAVSTRLGGAGYNFEQVLDWLDEAVRVEPDLIRYYRQVVRLIRSAMSFDEVCLVAA
jgi:hypothetical protein